MEKNLTMRPPPDFSDKEVCWLCTNAITDLQFRESNARSSFLERNGTKSDSHHTGDLHCACICICHSVLWETGKRKGNPIENLSPQNNRLLGRSVYICHCVTGYKSQSVQVNFRAIVQITSPQQPTF